MHIKQMVTELRASVQLAKDEGNKTVCLAPAEVEEIAEALERIKRKSDARKRALREHHRAYNELLRLSLLDRAARLHQTYGDLNKEREAEATAK